MKVLQFNQDATCCVVAPSASSVSIYNCDPFGKCFEFDTRGNNDNSDSSSNNMALTGPNDDDNASLARLGQNALDSNTEEAGFVVEMLFSTSLVAIADRNQGPIKGKRLKIVNTKRKSIICELVFPHEIVDVAMNRKRMCILLENDQIFVYDISCMKPLETIDIWENENNKGLNNENINQKIKRFQESEFTRKRRNSVRSKIRPRIVLSSDDRSILCYTSFSMSNSKPGTYILRDVVIYDALNIKPINYVGNAHKGNISCLAINHDGKLLATTSEKGTIVRIFNTGIDLEFNSNRQLQYEFRRGTRPSNIYQLSFNRSTTLVGCVGDTDTIHIFSLTESNTDDITTVGENTDVVSNNNRSNESSISFPSDTKISGERPKQIANFLSKKLKESISNRSLRRDSAHITVNESTRYFIGFPDEYPKEVYVAGDDGKFLIYHIPSRTGECVLSKSSSFIM